MMTDIEVLLDGSSVVDVLAVSSARRKRVEVNEREVTESDRNLFRKAKELELQSWLDHRVFDLVKRKFVDQERICERGGSGHGNRVERQKHFCVCWAFRIQI